MKDRILNNWSLRRGLYMALGIYLVVNSILDHQWFGVLIGSYFAAMGLFAFGCASGNCYGGSCEVEPKKKSNATIQSID